MQKKNYFPNLVLLCLVSSLVLACQNQSTSYLQCLPKELLHEVLHFSMGHEPLWHDANQAHEHQKPRVFTAIAIAALSKELCTYELQPVIITRMRKDIGRAKNDILEPFCPNDMAAMVEAFSRGQMLSAQKKSQFSDENPKMFQKLLPLKSVLLYHAIDPAWLNDFLVTKQCGGTLRKHIFIAALEQRHEYLVNYLWNSRYRTRIMKEKMRNRSFIAMAQCAAKRSGYDGIHEELKKSCDKLTEMRKRAQVWYPG